MGASPIKSNRKTFNTKNNLNMELTIKHLAAYLPYDVKVSNSINFAEFGICENTIELLEGYNFDNVITDKSEFKIEYCILHLRPLSDLTKEITINGETFVPSRYWGDENRIDMISHCSVDYEYCEYLEYFIVEKLLEWKFDIFNLISQGLAININEINNL